MSKIMDYIGKPVEKKIKENKDREKSFSIAYSKQRRILNILFDEVIYATSFFEHGHKIQSMLEGIPFFDEQVGEIVIDVDIDVLHIDLSKTKWFDTLAMCYFIVFLYDAKERTKSKLKFTFAYPDDSVFSAFLADNGFLYHIEKLDSNDPDLGASDTYDVTYSDVHKCFFPFDVFESRCRIPEIIANIRLRMENAFSSYIKPERLEYLINKTSYFLHETMENVFDHAYVTSHGFCGILIKNVNCNGGIDYKQYSQKYTSKTPYIKINMYEDSDAYLELYVMDTGCGLKESFSPGTNITDDNILDYIFENGDRSHKKVKEEATRYGGLYDIRELFNQDADGLGIKADSVWRYVYKYDNRNRFSKINVITEHGNHDGLIHGFALVAAIHLPKNQFGNIDDNSFFAQNAEMLVNDIFVEKKGAEILRTAYVIDERWETKLNQEWASTANKEITVIYPPSISTKAWITDKVYSDTRSNLVFIEVSDAEIKKYQSNIEGIQFGRVEANKIVVVTKSLNVSIFAEGEDGYFELKPIERKRYIQTSYVERKDITQSLSALMIFDKYYNSWRFWSLALNIAGDYSYISEIVKWSDGIDTLSGYLDFSQTNRIPECRDICVQKLNELRAIQSGGYFYSVDRFTDELCEQANFVMLVEKVEKLFNKDVIKRIIPLIPLSRNYEMGSLVVSPLILERIEQQIKKIKETNQEVVVTVFESVVFNVRLIEEVKQILYGIGADTVRVLTTLDRRRIPITESNSPIIAIGRVDSPALSGNNRCAICKALGRLEKCRNSIINEDIKNRISEIMSRWQYIQLSDNEYKMGLKSKRIKLTKNAYELIDSSCGNYFGRPLNIELDSALCSIIVEYTVISASAHLLLSLLNEEKLVENEEGENGTRELKLLLASTYVLLFATKVIAS